MTFPKYEINQPKNSKINAIAIVTFALGIAVTSGLMPQELADKLNELALLVFPVIVFILRTWFTNPDY